jgi:demethylmenaquinone methyltransferase/2-methoxy-6-polyprenyl-1,4-benzoquinol methylase
MSTYVLMRLLESSPRRYDLGIRLLTFGAVDRAYDRLASRIEAGQQVLDIGCGTGALSLRAARRGAAVKGIDVNVEMLEIAKARAQEAGLAKKIELREMGVAELDTEKPVSYDIVMSGLCFSELNDGERSYALAQAKRILKPSGLLIVSDEVKPPSFIGRVLLALIRAPLVVVTYLATGLTTTALENLPELVEKEGFLLESVRLSAMGSFMELVARKTSVGTP